MFLGERPHTQGLDCHAQPAVQQRLGLRRHQQLRPAVPTMWHGRGADAGLRRCQRGSRHSGP
eukprot:6797513-Pyramimonas_sp.AAC.1